MPESDDPANTRPPPSRQSPRPIAESSCAHVKAFRAAEAVLFRKHWSPIVGGSRHVRPEPCCYPYKMSSYSEIANTLTQSLHLAQPPVAVALTDHMLDG